MSALAIAALALTSAFVSALAGMALARRLPDHHLTAETRDAIKLSIGLIATLSALVLGMLISVASGIYQSERNEVQRLAADVLLLDQVLAAYGPETSEVRTRLRRSVAGAVEQMWPSDGGAAARTAPSGRELGQGLWGALTDLAPRSDEQRALKTRALDLATGLASVRYLLFAQRDSGVPGPFLAVLIVWRSLIFAGFGVLAPVNMTVIITLLAASFCVSGAFFLLLELSLPFDGFMRLSGDSLREALARIGQ